MSEAIVPVIEPHENNGVRQAEPHSEGSGVRLESNFSAHEVKESKEESENGSVRKRKKFMASRSRWRGSAMLRKGRRVCVLVACCFAALYLIFAGISISYDACWSTSNVITIGFSEKPEVSSPFQTLDLCLIGYRLCTDISCRTTPWLEGRCRPSDEICSLCHKAATISFSLVIVGLVMALLTLITWAQWMTRTKLSIFLGFLTFLSLIVAVSVWSQMCHKIATKLLGEHNGVILGFSSGFAMACIAIVFSVIMIAAQLFGHFVLDPYVWPKDYVLYYHANPQHTVVPPSISEVQLFGSGHLDHSKTLDLNQTANAHNENLPSVEENALLNEPERVENE